MTPLKRLRIVAYQADRGACYGYRIFNPLNTLQTHDIERNEGKKNLWDIKTTIRYDPKDLAEADAIILQRQVDGSAFWNALTARKHHGTRIIYEADDDFFTLPEWNPFKRHFDDPLLRQNFIYFLEECDAVFVSTEHLKKVYSQYNDTIYVLPNSIDPLVIPTRSRNNWRKVVGWAGSGTHGMDLERVRPALRSLVKDPDLLVRVIGGTELQDLGVHQISWVDWDSYYTTLALCDFDVGLAPLVDHPFNHSKSNIRYLELTMVGTPVIASNVGPYRCIEHEKTGLLIDDDRDWESAIRSLLDDRHFAEELVSNAREDVLQRYNIETNFRLWMKALRAVCEKKARQSSRSFELQKTDVTMDWQPNRVLLPRRV